MIIAVPLQKNIHMHTCALSFILYLSGEIERERKETGAIEQDTRQMQLDMTRLSTLINEKRGRQQHLEQDSLLRENDFIAALKVGAPSLKCLHWLMLRSFLFFASFLQTTLSLSQ